MKLLPICLNRTKLAVLLAVTWGASSHADEARFFRITGPVPATITGFTAEGYLTWTNVATNATFTVQTAPSLLIESNRLVASNWSDYVQIPATNAATTQRIIDPHPPAGMVLIPAGEFTMGDSLDGDSYALPLHTVQVSAFYMDKSEVTKALWDGVHQWAITNGYSFEYGALGKAANHPAHSMTWYDAVKWCNARSEKEGLRPAYYTDAGQTNVYRSGQIIVQNDWVQWNAGYRLPTEAEWEKAARGGASGQRFPWGTTISWSQANYCADPSGYAYDVNPTTGLHPTFNDGIFPYTSPVGYFAPNGYGLYDMADNVCEWCWDWEGIYSSGAQTDPHGPTISFPNLFRMLRGGAWSDHARFCRTAGRSGGIPPSYGNYFMGFRSALPPGQ